jgi:hypothetical protein
MVSTRYSISLDLLWLLLSCDKLSDDEFLENKYHTDPDACDLSAFTVVTNVISGCKNLVALFWQNKLGVDVDVGIQCFNSYSTISNINDMQDKYRIVNFERSDCLKGDTPLRSHLTLVDGPHRPSDRFLRLHFQRCIAVSACGGDAREDYYEQEIDDFMDELGVFDDEMDSTDP